MNEKKRYGNIEFIRLLFSAIIIYFHILHSNIIPYTGDSEILYSILAKKSAYAGYIVECFYIIAGFFLFKTYFSNAKISVMEFIINKVVRLWPVLCVSVILALLSGTSRIYPAFFNLFFLQCIGISFEYKGISWYISPYFWVSILLFSILKKFDNKKFYIILSVMIYFSYVININFCEGGFGRETIWNFLNLGVLRAIAGIGLGCMVGVIMEEIKKVLVVKNYNKRLYVCGGGRFAQW